ncbi:MAG: HAD family hydrolase [Gammaproteobacteria bacterium]|nr:MAG: HAD family hydrolase [Gammaproteobacteria bacterium]
MYANNKNLIILDADGTTIDAYSAIEKTFSHHGMNLGDEESFQKRHHIFKYLGGIKQFPANIRKNITKQNRQQIVDTLTDVYRNDAILYPGIADFIRTLIGTQNVIVGLVTRNITNEPLETLRQLFSRHDINIDELDFLIHVPLEEKKTQHFRSVREKFNINPARAGICGDENKDYVAAVNTGMHPYMVSYGFENYLRLTNKFEIPEDIISRTPQELCERVLHALEINSL